MSEIICSIEMITPDKAKEYLAKNFARNRNIRPDRIRMYAKEIADGNWGISTDAIGFSDKGDLINGQHRLNAVIMANKSARFVVVRGLPSESMMYLDGVLARSASDQLKIAEDDPLYGNKSAAAFVKALVHTKFGEKKRGRSSFEVKEMIDEYYFLCKFQSTRRGKGTINHANLYVSVFSALGVGGITYGQMEDFLKTVNYGTVDVEKKYNYQAANKLRHWYDTEYSGKLSGYEHYPIDLLERKIEEALYMYVNNVKSVRGKEDIYPATKEDFKKANEIVGEHLTEPGKRKSEKSRKDNGRG